MMAKANPTMAKISMGPQYMPQCEDQPVQLRQKVKQVRRLASLVSRVKKNEETYGVVQEAPVHTDLQHRSYLQIMSEWHAVVHACGYPPTFLHWVSQPERLGFAFVQLPRADGIQLLRRFAMEECNRLASNQNPEEKNVSVENQS